MKILINATNLHIGGGVQVASSFISELSYLAKGDVAACEISILCSSTVKSNLNKDFDCSLFYSFIEFNVSGVKPPASEDRCLFEGYDVCFTIFGPCYFDFKVNKHICGFAQPWIAYPSNDAYHVLSLVGALKNKIKFLIQSYLFKKYDQLIVEQKHVKDALRKVGYLKNNISVVSNCVSRIYYSPELWKPLGFDKSRLGEDIVLGFIGRAYPHKNIAILKKVNEILKDKYRFNCSFVFTFTPKEMEDCGFSDIDEFFSAGPIKVEQCPEFYDLLDALVFPSLIECFSASPIEAMKMNTTVIASDYPFVREVCGDAASYFDPMSADEIARVIFNTFSNTELRESKKKLGCQLVRDLPTAKDRAISYLNIIRDSI